MSSGLYPTNRNNPCPICDDVSGKCRTKDNEDQAVLCAGSDGHRKGDRFGVYVCTEDRAKGHTPHVWVLAKDDFKSWDSDRQQQYQIEKQQRRERNEAEKQRQIAAELPIEERDRLYRQILNSKRLMSCDRANLRERGLSDDEINSCEFRSVSKWEKVHGRFPANLPGLINVQPMMATLKAFEPGIICPVKQNGLIVGLKVRKRDSGEGGRYYWLTSRTEKNPNGVQPYIQGEIPLAFLPGDGNEIWITEGSEIKPVILHLKKSVTVAGGLMYWHSSHEHFKKFESKFKTADRIVLCVDAGAVLNKQVYSKLLEEAEFFESQGFVVKFAWWGQVSKEDGCDIDELKNYNQIEYLSVDQFEELIKEYEGEAHRKQAKKNWVKLACTFTPDYEIDSPKFYLPEGIPQDNVAIIADSDMATRKTDFLLGDMKASKNGSFLIGYRNNLLFQTIERGKDDYQLQIIHFNSEDGKTFLEDSQANIACCLDSISKVDGYFKDKTIYLDENCSVFLHGVCGGTLKERQPKAMRIFKDAIRQCKRLILLDGNQSDLYADVIAKIAPSKKIVKIKNHHKIAPHRFIFVDTVQDPESTIKRSRDKSPLVRVMLEPNVRPFVFSDSKAFTNILYEILTASGKKGIVVNADTAETEEAKACMRNPNKFFAIHKPDFFILSPTGNSGISYTDKGWFTHKISIFTGVLTTNGQLQALFRNRDDSIPHYIFCPTRTQIRKEGTPTGHIIAAVERQIDDRLGINKEMALLTADNAELAESIIDRAVEKCKKDEFFNFSNLITITENYERNNLRECLVDRLIQKGHSIEFETMVTDEGLKEQEKEIKDELLQKEDENRYNAPLLTPEKLDELKQRQDLNKETRHSVLKSDLVLNTLPEIDKDPVWQIGFMYRNVLKNRRAIDQHDRFYLLQNFETCQKDHEFALNRTTTAEDTNFGVMLGLKRASIKACKELKILETFVIEGKEFTKKSPEFIELINMVRASKKLQVALNITRMPEERCDGKEVTEFVKRVLGMFGLKLKRTEKKLTSDNERLQHYTFDWENYNSPDRLAILKCLERKYKDSNRIKERENITWVNPDQHAKILADKFRKAKDWSEVVKAKSEWESRKQYNTDGSESEEQAHKNLGIDIIISLAWYENLTESEQARIQGLELEGMKQHEILCRLDQEICNRDNLTLEHLQLLPQQSLWMKRLDISAKFGEEVYAKIKAIAPKSQVSSQPVVQEQQIIKSPTATQLNVIQGIKNQRLYESLKLEIDPMAITNPNIYVFELQKAMQERSPEYVGKLLEAMPAAKGHEEAFREFTKRAGTKTSQFLTDCISRYRQIKEQLKSA